MHEILIWIIYPHQTSVIICKRLAYKPPTPSKISFSFFSLDWQWMVNDVTDILFTAITSFPNSIAIWTGYWPLHLVCLKGGRGRTQGVYFPLYPATEYAIIFPMLCFSLKTKTTPKKHINSLQAIYNTLLRNPAGCLLQH